MPGLRERRALLAITSVPHLGPAATHRVLGEMGRRGDLACFFDLPAEELAQRFRLRPAAVAALRERAGCILVEAAALERELRERDIHWLVSTEPHYPRRLSLSPWRPPPVLFVHGNEALLDVPAVAFLNSADAPPRALELTDALADRVAARGVAVVSGHNTPAYKTASVAAVRHGAPRLLVMDRGLLAPAVDVLEREPVAAARVWQPEWDGLAGLALSSFRPRDGWAAANGRRRDELVAALATGLVAVHVRVGGIMEAIAQAALEHGMWVGAWDAGDGTGSAAVLAGSRGSLERLEASGRLDAMAVRIVEAVLRGAESGPRPGRAARRWAERERHFLYSLIELATGGILDVDRLLDFADPDPRPATGDADRSFTAAVRDATGVRDARPALTAPLEALEPGGWLAAMVDARALAGEDGARLRRWLADRAGVVATVALPPRESGDGTEALLVRAGIAAARPVLAVVPEAPVQDAAAHARYLAQARVRVLAHLSRSG